MANVYIVEAIWDGSESCTEGKQIIGVFSTKSYAEEFVSAKVKQKTSHGRNHCKYKFNGDMLEFDRVRISEQELVK